MQMVHHFWSLAPDLHYLVTQSLRAFVALCFKLYVISLVLELDFIEHLNRQTQFLSPLQHLPPSSRT